MNDRLREYSEEQAGWAFLVGLVATNVVSFALGVAVCVSAF